MADRTVGARPSSTWGGVLEAIGKRLGHLERRVAQQEARAGQTLPADYRFEVGPEGELVIRRVSTGDTTIIAV